MPTIYTPAHINSEIFELLRSSKYTPSASLRSAAPSEREPGGRTPFTRLLANILRCGRFSSPLRNSKDFTFHHSSGDTPSVSHSLDSSLREGAGERSHSTGYSLISGVGGRFSSPLRNAKNLTFYHSSYYTPLPGGGEGGEGGYRMSKTLRAVIWVGVPRRIFIRRVPASMSK